MNADQLAEELRLICIDVLKHHQTAEDVGRWVLDHQAELIDAPESNGDFIREATKEALWHSLTPAQKEEAIRMAR